MAILNSYGYVSHYQRVSIPIHDLPMPTGHDLDPLWVFQKIGTFRILRTVWVQREEHPRGTQEAVR